MLRIIPLSLLLGLFILQTASQAQQQKLPDISSMVFAHMKKGQLTIESTVYKTVTETRTRIIVDNNGNRRAVPYTVQRQVAEVRAKLLPKGSYKFYGLDGKIAKQERVTRTFLKNPRMPVLMLKGKQQVPQRYRAFYRQDLLIIKTTK